MKTEGHITIPLARADGKDGTNGLDGCIQRVSVWASGTEYHNDEALTSGTRYLDVVLVENTSTNNAIGYDVYKCVKTHTSSDSNMPPNTTYWDEFDTVYSSIYSSLILAKNAYIKFGTGNQFVITKTEYVTDEDGNDVFNEDGSLATETVVTAGLSGSTSGSKIRIWAGSSDPDSAPFRVDESGNLVATNATITGTVTATGGQIGPFVIDGTNATLTAKNTDGTNVMLLSATLIHFTDSSVNGEVYIGGNVMSSINPNFACCAKITVERTVSAGLYDYGYGNLGMYISVSGAGQSDNNLMSGNHALYIAKGDICGFRFRKRKLNSSATLDVMDSVIFVYATSDITLTLPSGCEDGQVFLVRKMSSGNITYVCMSSSDRLVDKYNSTNTSIKQQGSVMALLVYDANSSEWSYNVMPYSD